MIPAERYLGYRGAFPPQAPPDLPELRPRPWIEQQEHQQHREEVSAAVLGPYHQQMHGLTNLSRERMGLPGEERDERWWDPTLDRDRQWYSMTPRA